jgi:protein-S-isoprenylcysteine O-methyltransferase Ste14
MSRAATLIFAILCYAIFFATFLYLIVFVGDLDVDPLKPATVDNGPSAPPLTAAVIDIALIALFGLQHSIMARPSFKARWTKIVPVQAERSVYVLAASVALIILFLGWRPIDTIVWGLNPITHPIINGLIWLVFWLGWLTVLLSTFLINHFELFGLQQAWLHLRGMQAARPELRQPLFYRWVAHPLYAGFFLAFWATPEMTAGHLLLAAGMSAFMLIAIRYEERDLTDLFGEDYRRYRASVGGLIPRIGRRTTG